MKPTRFIIIDDDMLDNKLCVLCIKHALPGVEIVDFTVPEDGLNYIETKFNNNISVPTNLFLDINMPTMTGWEFLEKYDSLDQKIKDQITIYILSSSVDSRDKDKAAANKYIKGYLEKPIEVPVIKKLYEEQV